ncbi:DUF7344 domain-containing protein [Natronococcus zhouii]
MDQTEAAHALASADRQILLHELVERNGEGTITELSREVAARRHKIPLEKVNNEKSKRAQVRLIHTHLPQLVEKNILTINRKDRTVAFGKQKEIDQLFEVATELESWPPTDLLDYPSQNG